MTIGIDLRPLQSEHRYRGIGVYLSHLIAAIAASDRKNAYVFYMFSGPSALEGITIPDGFKYETVLVSKPFGNMQLTHLRDTLFQSFTVDAERLDVFLVPDAAFGPPRGDVPTVVVAHDLIRLIFEEQYFPRSPRYMLRNFGLKSTLGNYLARWLYQRQLRTLKNADGILAVSESTKRDLLRLHLYENGAAIAVTPLACDPSFFAAPKPLDVRERYGIAQPYLLYVGGSDFRKNPSQLLMAFEGLRREGLEVQLVLVGKDFGGHRARANPEFWKELGRSEFRDGVVLIDYTSGNDLHGLYAEAAAFVFPSLYEGFGIPVLEAMASGCPVIAYSTSSIPEVAGDAALLVDADESLASAVESVITGPSLRTAMIERGRAQSRKFSWERTAELTVASLERFTVRSRPAG